MYKKLPNPTLYLRNIFSVLALIFSFQALAFDDTYCGNIAGFEFTNGNSSITINDDQSYYLGDLPDNFYLNLLVNGYSQSAKFYVKNLSTGQTYNITENHLPYTFPGGNDAWNFGFGEFEVKAKLYKYNSCGSYCDSESIKFEVLSTPNCGDIDGFQFSNGSSTVAIEDDGEYSLNELPANFYIDLLVDGFSESASFKLKNTDTGQQYTIGENQLPYTVPGGNAAWSYGTGEFEIEAKIFEFNYCQGSYCDKEKIKFTITDVSTPDCGAISGFVFTDGTTSVPITNNQSYDINDLPYDFYIQVIVDGFAESASFEVKNEDTGVEYTGGDNSAPYTYPNNSVSWNLGNAEFEIKSEIFKFDNCYSSKCDYSKIKFTLYGEICGQIDGFEFSNFSSEPTVTIVDGGSYNYNDIPTDFNINVLTSGNIESAFNTLTNVETGEVYTKLENVLPYTFPGATNQVWTLGCGTFNFCSSVYKLDGANGSECDTACITFTITNCEADDCGNLDQFAFTNGTESTTIVDGESYNISDLPVDFYVDAIVEGTSESVRLTVTNLDTDETTVIVENVIPYTYPAGAAQWDLGLGNFQLHAEVFSEDYCNQTLCDTQIINFTLTDVLVCEPVFAGTASIPSGIVIIASGEEVFVTLQLTGDAILPSGYILGTVITSGPNLVIQKVSNSTTIYLPELGGNYKLHVLAYDPITLDLADINLGATTANDVLSLIGSNTICADLDAVGVPVMVIVTGSTDKVIDTIKTKEETIEANQINVVNETVNKYNNDVDLINDIKVYPNPAVNNLNVDITLFEGEILNYRIIDLNGKQVLSGSLNNTSNVINTKNLAAGLYLLKLNSEGRNITKKIVVKK